MKLFVMMTRTRDLGDLRHKQKRQNGENLLQNEETRALLLHRKHREGQWEQEEEPDMKVCLVEKRCQRCLSGEESPEETMLEMLS